MSDMHLLGHVRSRVVDHHNLRVGCLRYPDVRISELIGYCLSQDIGAQPEVEKAGPSDLGRLDEVGNLELGNEAGGNLTRRLVFTIGQAQRHIRLIVAELWSGGRPKLWIDTGNSFDPSAQQRSKGRHKPRLFHCPIDLPVAQLNDDRRGWRRSCL